MEETYNENESTQAQAGPALVITEEIKGFLRETIKWGKFLAVLGFIAGAILFLLGLALLVFGAALSSMTAGFGQNFPVGLMGGIYFAMGLFYYFPSKYLYDFCTYTKQALLINDQESLDYAFSRLKSVFKFWGILSVVVLVFYAIAILIGIAVGIFAGMAS